MKKSLALLSLALLGALGLGVAIAGVDARQTLRSPGAPTLAQNSPEDGELPDDQESGEQPADLEESQEDAQLQALVRVTPQQAAAAARTVASGAVSQVSLENEDGSVVYKVIIGQQEVMVDGGNGQVLETEAVGDEASPDAPPQGSLQVSDDDLQESGAR